MFALAGLSLLCSLVAPQFDDVEFFANIKSPKTSSIYTTGKAIRVTAVFFGTSTDPMHVEVPTVIVTLLKSTGDSFEEQHEAYATVTRDGKHPNRFNIQCDFAKDERIPPGQYLLLVRPIVDGKIVSPPCVPIKVVEGDEPLAHQP